MPSGKNPAASRDRTTGLVLLAFALVWSVTVYQTIPGGQGEGDVGPRAFPLMFGICLMVLSAIMVVASYRPGDWAGEESVEAVTWAKIKVALSVFGLVLAYGFLLFKIGFVLATPLVAAAAPPEAVAPAEAAVRRVDRGGSVGRGMRASHAVHLCGSNQRAKLGPPR